MRRSIFAALAVAAALSACAARPPEALRIDASGEIQASGAAAFADCVADSWRADAPALSSIVVQREQRADGFRVLRMAYGITEQAADVRGSHVELRQAGYAGGAPQRAFSACLARYAAT